MERPDIERLWRTGVDADQDLATYVERLEDVARAAAVYIGWSQGENGDGIQLMKSLTRAMGKLPPIFPKEASK